MVLADLAGTIPPPPNENRDDFGFHNDYFDVKLVTLCADLWGWTPDETLNQSESFIWDMLRYKNLSNEIRNPDNPITYAPPDAFEDQPEGEAKRVSL